MRAKIFPAIYEVAMNSEEQSLIDDLFARLQQAQTQAEPRDALAQARINQHLGRQPDAGYFMTQAILVQEAALKRLDEQNQALAQQVEQLRNQVLQAQAQTPAAAPSGSGGFLSSLFGGPREPQPGASRVAPTSSGNGWTLGAQCPVRRAKFHGCGAEPRRCGATGAGGWRQLPRWRPEDRCRGSGRGDAGAGHQQPVPQ
jgi:hypothetical protein